MSEIVLSTETKFVLVAEIPAMIARALHPEVTGQPHTVSYFIKFAKPEAKGETAKWNGWPIDDSDRDVLCTICGEEPPVDVTEEEVRPYLDKVNASGLDWVLDVCWTNHVLNANILYHIAEEEHKKAIKLAIRRGQLQALNPATRLPANEYQENAVVTIASLTSYLEQFEICVRRATLVSDLPKIYEQQEAEKHAAGRYTLEEAANAIQTATGESSKIILPLLSRAVQDNRLAAYPPGSDVPIDHGTMHSDKVRGFYVEVYWGDLNTWLVEHLPRLVWKFPSPVQESTPKAVDSKPGVQIQQEDEILRVIREALLHDPLELPKNIVGIKGVRGNARELIDIPSPLFQSTGVFNKAWERLSEKSLIKFKP